MTISAEHILAVTRSVITKWAKQRKAEEHGMRSRASRVYVYSDRVNFTAVAGDILPSAYDSASDGGRLPVSKRHFYYACREEFKQRAGRELTFNYFANTLLLTYMNTHPETAAWRVTADPRGTLRIPNAHHDVRVPVGTLQMDEHLYEASQACDPFDVNFAIPVEWPSLAPGQRYQGVMYVEKEGFDPLLEEARIAERYDLAIISCKGQSVTAARKYVDRVCAVHGGVPLFIVHDFDKFGFEISQCLTSVSSRAEENDRVAYRFANAINFVDFGLRLEDVKKYGLKGESCKFDGYFPDDAIATPEEREYLQSGRRVELNELPPAKFLEWLESKLNEHLPKRLVPDDAILEAAYRRAVAVARVNRVALEAGEEAVREAKAARMPQTLRGQIEAALEAGDARAWDTVLYDLAVQQVGSADEAG